MLLPFDFAVISVDEAKKIMDFIVKMTATKKRVFNDAKIRELGMMEIYQRLQEFVQMSNHYKNDLQYFEPSSKADKSDDRYSY